jgi:hypothetical protein
VIQNPETQFRIIWADKAMSLAILVFLSLLALCWSIAFLVIGSLGARHLWSYMGVQGVMLAVLVPASVLLLVRLLTSLPGLCASAAAGYR